MRTQLLILAAMGFGCLIAQVQTPTISGVVNNATTSAGPGLLQFTQ